MNDIDVYYQSMRQVLEQMMRWRKPKPPIRQRAVNVVLSVVVIAFALSVIPILPAVLVLVGGRFGLRIGWVNLSAATLGTFLTVWGVAFVAGLLLLVAMGWLKSRVDSGVPEPPRPAQTLSPEQLTFVAVYEAYKELRTYFVSHVDQHVDRSFRALRRALRPRGWEYASGYDYRRRAFTALGSEPRMVVPAELSGDARVWIRPSFVQEVEVARSFLRTFEKYAWFQLDGQTRATLQALITFTQKVPPRLRRKEDLPAVLGILEKLSEFAYAYLPEHKAYMVPEALAALQAAGAASLRQFVQEVNDLSPYSPREMHKDSVAEQSVTVVQRIKDVLSRSIFLRFTAWFVLILALTSGAVFFISRRLPLSPDSMATLIVGTSVASAATLAVFRPRSKGQD